MNNKMIMETDHPIDGPLRLAASPIRTGERSTPPSCAPTLAEHTRELLRDLLGYSDHQIDVVLNGTPSRNGMPTPQSGQVKGLARQTVCCSPWVEPPAKTCSAFDRDQQNQVLAHAKRSLTHVTSNSVLIFRTKIESLRNCGVSGCAATGTGLLCQTTPWPSVRAPARDLRQRNRRGQNC